MRVVMSLVSGTQVMIGKVQVQRCEHKDSQEKSDFGPAPESPELPDPSKRAKIQWPHTYVPSPMSPIGGPHGGRGSRSSLHKSQATGSRNPSC